MSVKQGLSMLNVYAMIRYKFESNSQRSDAKAAVGEECVCYD